LKNSKSKLQSQLHDRLFFHDIINHTHGLLLFLNAKKISDKPIDKDEIELMETEIRTLQCLIKDHFKFTHKNLEPGSDKAEWVKFGECVSTLKILIANYFPDNAVFVSVNYKQDLELVSVYFPLFYRIMNNLIKNMAEAGSSEIHLEFASLNGNFTIETRNTFTMLDKITRINKEDLGLKSINTLVEDWGGEFEFEKQSLSKGSEWINRISFPLQRQSMPKKMAA
jgi:K+-sensing histidine kinase KdpD